MGKESEEFWIQPNRVHNIEPEVNFNGRTVRELRPDDLNLDRRPVEQSVPALCFDAWKRQTAVGDFRWASGRHLGGKPELSAGWLDGALFIQRRENQAAPQNENTLRSGRSHRGQSCHCQQVWNGLYWWLSRHMFQSCYQFLQQTGHDFQSQQRYHP